MAAPEPQLTRPRREGGLPPRKPAWAAAVALAALAAGCGAIAPQRPELPPDGRMAVPAAVQRDVHVRVHDLARICRRRGPNRAALARTTATFIRYFERYPSQRFRMQIDDEQGSTLSALLVLRHALRRCSQPLAARVDEVLPADIRRGLSPLRAGRRPEDWLINVPHAVW